MSDEETVEQIKRTVAIVEKADVPADLRAAVYDSVWRKVSGANEVQDIGPDGGRGTTHPDDNADTGLAALAKKLDVAVDVVAEVYAESADGTLALHVTSSKLSAEKSKATVEIALLVCAARQCGGEEWTDGKVIRAACDDFGKYDKAHNARFMDGGDKHWMISGASHSKKFKLRKKVGWEAVADLIRKITVE